VLITNSGDYYKLCQDIAELGADETIGLDTETTGLALWTSDVLRGVCVGFRDQSYYVPVSHPGSWNVGDTKYLRTALERCAALPVFHNAQFDFRSLEAGIGLAPPMERYRDTQVLAWLEDENRRKGLKYLGERFFGEDAAAEKKYLDQLFRGVTQAQAYKVRRLELAAAGRKESAAESKAYAAEASAASKLDWATIRAEDIAAYAAKDAELTLRVYDYLLAHKEFEHVSPAVQPLHDVQAAAYRMTRRGVAVDEGRCVALSEAATAQAAALADGFEVNIASAPQLATLIYDTWGLPVTERTEGGAPSTAAAVLEAMAGDHPGLDQILEYRRLTKAAGFYDGLLEHLDANGRVHTTFNVTGTVTGRWSSSWPNLQQVPKKATNADAWSVFTAPAGYELVGFDIVSAELFVAASLAEDAGMMAALTEEGRSFHAETAQAVFGSVVEPYRTLAKNLNYGIPYGIGPKKFASYIAKGLAQKQTSAHYRQAKDAIDAHRAQWPDLHLAISNTAAYAEVTGRLPLGWPGRFRHFVSDTMAWPVPSYQAINSLVQGSVALFVNDTLLAVEAPAAELGAEPVLAVHDSLKFYCPVGAVDQLHELVQKVSDDLNPFALRILWSRD
jgi:DNA polymerase-1